jgi:hypothetical protein
MATDSTPPVVSDIFKAWTNLRRTYYSSDTPSEPDSDLDFGSSSVQESPEETMGPGDILCARCSELNFRSIFKDGISKAMHEGAVSKPVCWITLGSLRDVTRRDSCSFCRIVRCFAEEKHPDLFQPNSKLGVDMASITCFLQTIRSDELPELPSPGSGPATLYIDITFATAEGEIPATHQRYLVLDAANAPDVSDGWVDTREPLKIKGWEDDGDEVGESKRTDICSQC